VKIQSHRDLIVWQKAMDLAVLIYSLVAGLPSHERFGLCSQATRAAVSVAANIAEGNARGTPKDYANFLAIARGSLMETETYLLLAVRLEYLSEETAGPAMSLILEVDKMLRSIRTKLLG